MIKKVIYIAIGIIVFYSCQSVEKVSKPEKLIKEDKMVEILTEIAFVKASKSAFKKVLEEKKFNPEAYILQKHGIDSLVFAKNNEWYASKLDVYQKIFTKVKENLETEKTKYEKLSKKEDSIKKINDSIRKAKELIKKKKEDSIRKIKKKKK